MANDTRHEAVWDWLLTCPHIKDMFFNFSTVEDGGTVLVPLTAFNDTAEQEFVDGSSIRVYDFNIVHFSVYSTAPNDRQNIDVLANVERIADWVTQQDAAGNYPVFPNGCHVLGIEVLPSNGGYVSAWDESGAKYMLQIRIRYEKE